MFLISYSFRWGFSLSAFKLVTPVATNTVPKLALEVIAIGALALKTPVI